MRLGLVVPGDCHVDDEFWRLAAPEAVPFVTRTIGARDDEMGGESIEEVTTIAEGPEIGEAARRLTDVAPVAAAYVDTSISFVRGIGGDTEIADRMRATLGCPSIVTSTAAAAALSVLGARTVAAISPYTDDLNERMRGYFRAHGFEMLPVHALRRTYPGGTTSRELGAYPVDELIEDVRAAVGRLQVGAVFIPCTAVRAVGAIEPLERLLGVPVVTSIQATLWAVLRLAGIPAGRPGAGRLFEIAALPEEVVRQARGG